MSLNNLMSQSELYESSILDTPLIDLTCFSDDGVATISRLFEIIGLFCRISSLL